MPQIESAEPHKPVSEENADSESGTFSFSYPGSRPIGGNLGLNTNIARKPVNRRKPVRILAILESANEALKQAEHVADQGPNNDTTEPMQDAATFPAGTRNTPLHDRNKANSPFPHTQRKTPSKSPLSHGMGWVTEQSRHTRQILRKEEQLHGGMHNSVVTGKINTAKVIYTTPQHGNTIASGYKAKYTNAVRAKPLVFSQEKTHGRDYAHCSTISAVKPLQMQNSRFTTPPIHLSAPTTNSYKNSAIRNMNFSEDIHGKHHDGHTPQHLGGLGDNKENEVYRPMVHHASGQKPSMKSNFHQVDAPASHVTESQKNLRTWTEEDEPSIIELDDSDENRVPRNIECPIISSEMIQQPLNLTLTSEYKEASRHQMQVQSSSPEEGSVPSGDSPAIPTEIASNEQEQPLNLTATSQHRHDYPDQPTDPELNEIHAPEMRSVSHQPFNHNIQAQQQSQENRHNSLERSANKPPVFYGKQPERPIHIKPEKFQSSWQSSGARSQSSTDAKPSPHPAHEVAEMPPPVLPVKAEHLKSLSQSEDGCAKPLGSSKTLALNGKQYTIINQLGKGGSSIVYQAMVHATRAHVAIKVVKLSGVDPKSAQGYIHEIDVLKKLQKCDSVIRLLDYQFEKMSQTLIVVMEKGDIDFANFLRDLSKTKKVSNLMIGYYWSEMVNAVKSIHEIGIIHSDLKPANFLLVCGRLKLIDFGIASSLNKDMTSVVKDSIVGTFNYMSPEAVGGLGKANCKKISYKSDVWSLGCILYNLVYGKTPFADIVNHWAKLVAITEPGHVIKFPSSVDCPQVLLMTMKRCLMYDPRDRPSTTELLQPPFLLEFKDTVDNFTYSHSVGESTE